MATSSASKRKTRTIGEYVFLDESKLGSGSFANVYKARHVKSHVLVAVKAINVQKLQMSQGDKIVESLQSEIDILFKIKHPNIVGLYDAVKESKYWFLMLEFCDGGDLHRFIHKRGRLDEPTAQALMKQLAAGMHYLYSHHLIHRDLKPQNLLLTSKQVVKIADFGFARQLEAESLAMTLCGSPLYMAPEIVERKRYDAKADLWSAGTILFEMVVGRTPFTGVDKFDLMNNIKTTAYSYPEGLALSDVCLGLIAGLLKPDPLARMSFDDFFASPFLSGFNDTVIPGGGDAMPVPHAEVIRPDGGGPSEAPWQARTAPARPALSDLPMTVEAALPAPASGVVAPLEAPTTSLAASVAKRKDTEGPGQAAVVSRVAGLRKDHAAESWDHGCYAALDVSEDYVVVSTSPTEDSTLALAPVPPGLGAAVPSLTAVLQYVEAVSRSAVEVAAMGGRMAEAGQEPAALALLVKCLSLFQHGVTVCDNALAYRTSITGPDQELLVRSLEQAQSSLRSHFGRYLGRAEQLHRRSKPGTLVPSAEKLIYEGALAMARDAAVKEVLGEEDVAAKQYVWARRLLESLTMEAAPLSDHDSYILEQYVQSFSRRIQKLNKAPADTPTAL